MISKQENWQHGLLTTTAIGISLVTIYSVINSGVGNRTVADFTFPHKVPLPDWEYISSQTIDVSQFNSSQDSDFIPDRIISANRYQYREQDTQLDIDMYYLTHTRGNIKNLLLVQTKIPQEILETQQIKQQGNNYYGLFSDRDRTYLSACLNPTGNTTVTHQQFSGNLNQLQLNLKLWGNWLFGKASIRDRRCLWITISTANESSSFLEPEDILEQVWQNWYQWWQPRFPNIS